MKLRTHSPLWRRVARVIGRRLLRAGDNDGVLSREGNGEAWLLRTCLEAHRRRSPGRPFVIFDAGANAGDYTQLILDAARTRCPVTVHAFEPAPVNVARLRERFDARPEVRIVPAALSDTAGEAPLYAAGAGSSLASLVPREVLGGAAGVPVPLLRLDDHWARNGVTRVDFLKLDVEGHELAALRGLGRHLDPAQVDVIQFEYGGAALDAGVTLRDLTRLLAGAGYRIAKLFPRALELREYHPGLEHYTYSNYVALSPRWLTE